VYLWAPELALLADDGQPFTDPVMPTIQP